MRMLLTLAFFSASLIAIFFIVSASFSATFCRSTAIRTLVLSSSICSKFLFIEAGMTGLVTRTLIISIPGA
uniref:Uncharacterized protein n=1 Tax=Rhizophora mucronata TaxID=61149 RepID=A0A2P2NFR8_RHIMU